MEKIKDQTIEVEFDEKLVDHDIEAQGENDTVLYEQTTFNKDSIENLIGEGATIDEQTEIN